MTDDANNYQSRFAFPIPAGSMFDLRREICRLMLDGRARSVREIQSELGTEKEISARVREARAAGWPFNDARSTGPDPKDGVFRYRLNTDLLTREQRQAVA